MIKDFDLWNDKKKALESLGPASLDFHEREVWWCSMGLNLGDEEDGKNELFERPVIIIKKFNHKVAWIVPMTSKQKFGPYYAIIEHEGILFSAILSQMKLMSIKRFRRFVRKVSRQEWLDIKLKLINLLSGG